MEQASTVLDRLFNVRHRLIIEQDLLYIMAPFAEQKCRVW